MEASDKRLLLTDLCQRIPYWTRVQCQKYFGFRDEGLTLETYDTLLDGYIIDNIGDYVSVKPYLRPMYTMTDSECELSVLKFGIGQAYDKGRTFSTVPTLMAEEYTDWLNENHFDYRCLISKGLALRAPDGMYGTVSAYVDRNQYNAVFGSECERSRRFHYPDDWELVTVTPQELKDIIDKGIDVKMKI